MARLFSALLPPRFAILDLAERLSDVRGADERVRFIAVERWHITLRFFGEDDPRRRAAWLARRLDGFATPRMRLEGSDTFPGVYFAGVGVQRPTDVAALKRLARACGADRGFKAHLTLARWRAPEVDRDHLTAFLAGYTGPWFTPDSVALVQSDHGEYQVLDRIPLTD